VFKGGLSTAPNDPGASIAGVPVLAVKGQFEEFGPGPSKRPIRVTVVAYQYGSAVEPLAQSAEPVRQIVLVAL
jgi:hypothetical protein